ncbi:hypothetical protein [Anaerovorax sp. IOR16]|uniref:hypothetical protein n=1 Tax=Anaerovorax sp. IOR16 TaxID=2773458 RepID=UPI0019D2082B|nr:hypothetical protein [Anaerovorax sp. IOR16]
MIKQKIAGLGLIFISIVIIILAVTSTDTNPESHNVNAALFTLPLGLYSLFTKRNLEEVYEEDEQPKRKRLHTRHNNNKYERNIIDGKFVS